MSETVKETPKTASEQKVAPKTASGARKSGTYLAAVLVRGEEGTPSVVKKALFLLRMRNKHVCVVLEDTPSTRGMLVKCKDYITYGEISSETKKLLEEKRGVKDSEKKLKPFFRLHPPRGGFERRGIKKSFAEGGVLGNRGTKMNDLLVRMI